MPLPNFLIIGAAKAGTTALHSYLRQHPEIFMPQNKEPGFFVYQNTVPTFLGPGDDYAAPYVVRNIARYQELFHPAKQEKAIGEASTAYLYQPAAAVNIKEHIPHAKLIAVLRHPVDRAFSSYLQLKRDGRETSSNFAEALEAESDRITKQWNQIWHYRQMGFYGAQLERYYKIFSHHQIRVYLYNDFQARPVKVLQDMFQFLGVDDAFIPNMDRRLNVSGLPKHEKLYGFLAHHNIFRDFLKRLVPLVLRRRYGIWLQKWPLHKPDLSKDLRLALLEDYHDDILLLQSILQRDLSGWLK